jgi:5-methylcytosine-specific restriction endonuclease McrA
MPEGKGMGWATKFLWQDPAYRQRMSDAHKGKIHSGSFKKGHKLRNTGRTRFKKGQVGARKGLKNSPEHKKKFSLYKKGRPSLNTRGEKNWNWKGGTSRTESQKIRQSIEYKNWRRAVFDRDDYTCQECHQRGGKLQADHIKPFSIFPELIFSIENGKTLCIKCHFKTKTYGGRIHKLKKEHDRSMYDSEERRGAFS